MSALDHEIVQSALGWVGTPYRHQASCRGGGADCLGLLRGVWREIYGCEPEAVPNYSADWSEPQGKEFLWHAAKRHLKPQFGADFGMADVLLFRMRDVGVAKHLGLVTSVDKSVEFTHAYSGQGVVVSPLSEPWRRRIVARFRFPERNI